MNPIFRHCLEHEKQKSFQSNKECVTTVGKPKPGSELDQMIWPEVLKLLHDILSYANVQVVVYILEKIGVLAMSADGDADFTPMMR